jgi:hypothetical protein
MFQFPHAHPSRAIELAIELVGRSTAISSAQLAEFDTTRLPQLLDWNRFEEMLLLTDSVQGASRITLSRLHPGYFRQLLTLVKEGEVLTQLYNSGRHGIILQYENWFQEKWQVILEDIVASVPQMRDVDGQVVELDYLKRFDWWRRCNQGDLYTSGLGA